MRIKITKEETYQAEVARTFDLCVGNPLEYEDNVLFVPRFDRSVMNGHLIRHGMHSLYTLAGITGYGKAVQHDTYCRALAEYTTDPVGEIREYPLMPF